MSGPTKYIAVPKRPLRLAEKLSRIGKQSVLAGTVPVVLDAVSDWWHEMGSQWPVTLPPAHNHARLPWPKVWAEWRPHGTGQDVGVLIEEKSVSAIPPAAAVIPGADLLVEATCFVDFGAQIQIDPPIVWGIRHPSSYVTAPNTGHTLVSSSGSSAEATLRIRDVFQGLVTVRAFNALLSVRNVECHDMALDRAQRRRMGISDEPSALPWVQYKTLAIRLPPSAKGSQRSGSRFKAAIPFHLVRGSLADYRHGPGLFGKPEWRTVVWRPMHTRGYLRVGAVAKTYNAKIAGDQYDT